MLRSSREVIDELIDYGVDFARTPDGELDYTREAAHSRPRICYHKDITGKEITSKLITAVKSRRNIVSTKKKTIPWADHNYERVLTNKNKLLSTYEGAIGVKTGFTSKAGRCLVYAAQREGMTLVGCVLNCPDWFDESKRILDTGFETYDLRVFHRKGDTVDSICTGGRRIDIGAKEDVKAPIRNDEDAKTEIRLNDLALPVYEGQKAGEISVTANGEVIAVFDLVCQNTETTPSFMSALKRTASLWAMRSKIF